MIGLKVKADLSQVEQYLRSVKSDRVPNAAARALNKTLGNTQTEASKQIRQERALSASVVKKAMRIERATKLKLEGALVASGRPIPLRDYQARQTMRKGVTVKVSPGGRKAVVFAGNKAFIVQKIGGHVFARTGKRRLPIKKLYGPSIPATFLKQQIVDAMTRVAGDNWPKRFGEELRYELSRQ